MKKEKIVSAIKNGTFLKNVDDNKLMGIVNTCASVISMNSGQGCETIVLLRFIDYLKEDYYFVTDYDFVLIMQYGSIGEFGDFYGINQKSFLKWTKDYLKARDVIMKEIKKFESANDNTNTRLIDFSNLLKQVIREKKFTEDGIFAIKKLYAGTKFLDNL